MKEFKICSKCKEEKPYECFSKDARKKSGVRPRCKSCIKIDHRKYRKENRDKVYKYFKEYIKNNKKQIAESKRKYYEKNKEEIKQQKKEYYQKNKKQIIKKSQKYRREWKRKKYASDTNYKLAQLIRSSSGKIMRAVKKNKKMKSLEYLGCSLDEFRKHIESLWQEGMSWDNHGFDGWHLDHIKPIDWFIKNSDDPWQANHYTNLQPLWARENIIKKNKL